VPLALRATATTSDLVVVLCAIGFSTYHAPYSRPQSKQLPSALRASTTDTALCGAAPDHGVPVAEKKRLARQSPSRARGRSAQSEAAIGGDGEARPVGFTVAVSEELRSIIALPVRRHVPYRSCARTNFASCEVAVPIGLPLSVPNLLGSCRSLPSRLSCPSAVEQLQRHVTRS